MGKYRKNLSGELAFRSFVSGPLSEVCLKHEAGLDALISETALAVQELNTSTEQLSEEQIRTLLCRESEASCQLAWGVPPSLYVFFASDTDSGQEWKKDAVNLNEASVYALEALDELPLSGRLLRNAHYLMCRSERYEKKYPGEFRISPVWIGRKNEGLQQALFVPPIEEDLTESFAELERYIHYEEAEHVLVRAALIHYQFETIHPFIDANGRVGRLLNLLFLMDQGVLRQPVLQFSDILRRQPVAYYRRLQHVHDTGEYEPWVVFFLNALREAACATCRQIAAEK